MSMKKSLLSAAALGLAAGAAASTAAMAEEKKSGGEEKCYGVNSCKGTGKCGVSKSDIEATKAAFGEKFAKSKTHDCAGMNECGGSMGNLEWVSVPKGTCVKEKKGFLIVEKAGKKTVVNK